MKLKYVAMAGFAAMLPVAAQQHSPRGTSGMTCDQNNRNGNGQVGACEIREENTAFAGRLSIDAGTNGGITVKGWDQPGMLVRSKIDTWAADQGAAKSMATQINVSSSAGQVRATGPSTENKKRDGRSVMKSLSPAMETSRPRRITVASRSLTSAAILNSIRPTAASA